VIRLREEKLGRNHPDALFSKHVLAQLYHAQRKYDRAEQLLRAVVAAANEKPGPGHPNTQAYVLSFARTLLKLGKYTEAERLLRDSLRNLEKTRPDDWSTFDARSQLGEALLGQKKHADAEPVLVQGYEGLKKREAKVPPQYRAARLQEALERLVLFYDGTGKKDEAARWREALDALSKVGKPASEK
jgi:predicted Zn-dependent protease